MNDCTLLEFMKVHSFSKNISIYTCKTLFIIMKSFLILNISKIFFRIKNQFRDKYNFKTYQKQFLDLKNIVETELGNRKYSLPNFLH